MSDELTINVNTLKQIIYINQAIQLLHAKLSLNGKDIICVALDGTCTFNDPDVTEIKLTDSQFGELLVQTVPYRAALQEKAYKE